MTANSFGRSLLYLMAFTLVACKADPKAATQPESVSHDYVIKFHPVMKPEHATVLRARIEGTNPTIWKSRPDMVYSSFRDPKVMESRLLSRAESTPGNDTKLGVVDYVNERDVAKPVANPFVRFRRADYRVGNTWWFDNDRIVKNWGFEIAETEVTNSEFNEFVKATGYVTDAERKGWSWVPNFEGRRFSWKRCTGASWREPMGPDLVHFEETLDHPVTQVSPHDAHSYAAWKKCRLPYAVEWEIAVKVIHTIEGSGDTIKKLVARFDLPVPDGKRRFTPIEQALLMGEVPLFRHGQPKSALENLDLSQFQNKVLTDKVSTTFIKPVEDLIDGVAEICEQYGLLVGERRSLAAPYVGRSWLDQMTPRYPSGNRPHFASDSDIFLFRQRFLKRHEAYPHIGFRLARDLED